MTNASTVPLAGVNTLFPPHKNNFPEAIAVLEMEAGTCPVKLLIAVLRNCKLAGSAGIAPVRLLEPTLRTIRVFGNTGIVPVN